MDSLGFFRSGKIRNAPVGKKKALTKHLSPSTKTQTFKGNPWYMFVSFVCFGVNEVCSLGKKKQTHIPQTKRWFFKVMNPMEGSVKSCPKQTKT